MTYRNFYLDATNLADKIRSGEYKQVQDTRMGEAQNALVRRPKKEVVQESQPKGYRDLTAEYLRLASFTEQDLPEEVTQQEPKRFAGAGDYTNYQQSYAPYKSDAAERIKAKLVNRGMPEHIAEGFVMNFVDESGLNAVINEANPTVKGSRGGFGLYQLTGPRRVGYEAYADLQGINPQDPMEQEDAQLGYLFEELQGPEKDAWKTIQTADNAGTAAAYVAKYFLRPAEEHLRSRVAKYASRPAEFTRKPLPRG